MNPVFAALYYICWKYIRVGTSVALAPRLFPIFCATSCFRIQKLCTLNEIHYSADKDVGIVTWFQEMMGQVPKPK